MASLLVLAKELQKAGRISKAGKGLLKGAKLRLIKKKTTAAPATYSVIANV